MERPEYIKCVEFTKIGDKRVWCDRSVYGMTFLFQDVDHAAINGFNEGHLVVCPECLENILLALNNGY